MASLGILAWSDDTEGKAFFAQFDTSGNGLIDLEEFKARLAQIARPGAQERGYDAVAPVHADYDQDGVVKLLVSRYGLGEGWHREPETSVVTVKSGVIVPYPPLDSINLDKAEDVDHDGLPDLWTYEPFEERTESESLDYLRGPPLLLHARHDGTFAKDDAVVRAAVQKECPKMALQDIVTLPRKSGQVGYVLESAP